MAKIEEEEVLLIGLFARPTDVETGSKDVRMTLLFGLDADFFPSGGLISPPADLCPMMFTDQ